MQKERIIVFSSVIFSLAVAALCFFYVDVESFLRDEAAPVTLEELTQNRGVSYTGSAAGADIPRLSGRAEFAAMNYCFGYVTAEPLAVIKTDVYRLKPWVEPFITKRVNGRATGPKKRKKEVIQSAWFLWEDYQPYYLLELPDHSYLLAQIPQVQAAAIKRGEAVTLPLGEKDNVPSAAQQYLTEICQTYGVATDAVFYTWDDAWYEKHNFILFAIRFVFAAVICLALAVGLMTVGNKIFRLE